MHDARAEIIRRHQPVGSDLFLKAEVPLLRVRRLRMQRHRFITAERHERTVLRKSARKWITAREALPRVGKRRWVLNRHVVAERWALRKSDVIVQRRQVVEDAVRRANRHLPPAFRIPRESYARREIRVTIEARGIAWISGVTGKCQARGCIRVDRTLLSRCKSGGIEVEQIAILRIHG